MISTQRDTDLPDPGLAHKLGFTSQDLRANRQAQLSLAQQQRVHARLRAHWRRTGWALLAFLISYATLFIVGLAAGGSTPGQNQQPDLEPLVLPMLLLGAMFAGVMVFVLLSSLVTVRDLRRSHVSWVEGSAHPVRDIVKFKTFSYPRYRLFIKQGRRNQRVFQLAESAALDGFDEGQRYRIYYVKYPPVHILLSGEAL